ncbi:cupin [Candidatus Synechococcus calcipolaris G9]|uniref:Cupin n=1 Tax=Candidatus Synechococcus calcipolaris G9 TaxID=1497997 RepID=A0ABT6F295_9SYNE|nr:cupin [Candidatus Synechococcus calcipolaris]MDG2991952.1 cupin [Candidatus Synechococcus calcipolaris G9]
MIYFATTDGSMETVELPEVEPSQDSPYRLYRFLTDLEDILARVQGDRPRLEAIFPLVQRLLRDSPWLYYPDLVPHPQTGWAVQTLYDEPFYPLTVQRVAWAAGATSPIHNHGTWGIVAILQGEEKNTFYQRSPQPAYPHRLELGDECTLGQDQMIGFFADAIHHVQALDQGPTLSFNLYGETNYDQRWQFDLATHSARLF